MSADQDAAWWQTTCEYWHQQADEWRNRAEIAADVKEAMEQHYNDAESRYDAAQAEIAALRVECGKDQGDGCNSGCSYGTDDVMRHNAYCKRFGLVDEPTTFAEREWVPASAYNMRGAEIAALKEQLAKATDDLSLLHDIDVLETIVKEKQAEIAARDEQIADLKTGLETAIKDKATLSERIRVLDINWQTAERALEHVKRERRKAEAALAKFGQHKFECNSIQGWGEDNPCDCGLDDTLRV